MAKTRSVTAGNAKELAQMLGLSEVQAQEWEVQYALLKRLRQIVKDEALTHSEVAQRAGSSRTRVTAILNGNLDNVSSDLLIRLVSALGYRVKVTITRSKPAA